GPTLFIAEARNLRSAWKWLNNPQIARDRIQLPPGAARPMSHWPGLRAVRVRLGQVGETPEAYAENEHGVGFSKGLWTWSDRVFMSTAGKPDTMKAISALQSLVHDYETRET